MELAFSFRATPAEHARVSMLMLRRKRWYKIFVGLIVVVIVGLVILPTLQGLSAAVIAATVLPYVLILGLVVAGLPYIQQWQLSRVYRHTPTLQQEQTHEFSDEGFRMRNPLANTLVRWDAFLEVFETKEFFLLYISRSMAYFLPKRAIATPEELTQLRSFLRTHLGQIAKLQLLAA
jgi:lysylphosphatidylglycerol synthetase-like protein (DUF2156 family)